MVRVKSEKEIDLMREPCKIVRDTLNFVGSKICAGMSTKEIDELVERYIRSSGAYPSCLGYGGFPASACISVNEMVVHGIPDDRIIQDGDIVVKATVCELLGAEYNVHFNLFGKDVVAAVDVSEELFEGDLFKVELNEADLYAFDPITGDVI